MRAAYSRAVLLGIAVSLGSVTACNLIIGISGYTPCSGAECVGTDAGVSEGDGDAGSDATDASDATDGDASSDAADAADAIDGDAADDGGPCSINANGTSAGCASSTPVCSHGACASITALAQGGTSFHSCALLSDGRVRCWGANESGELGDGTFDVPQYPVEVVGLPMAAVEVSVGYSFSCARLVNGDVYCWGANPRGELANDAGAASATPVQIVLGGPATAISAGHDGACAISMGKVLCWGSSQYGQIGCPDGSQKGATYKEVVPLNPDLPWPATALAVGLHMSCFAGTDLDSGVGGVTCYGDGLDGLGDSQFINYMEVCLESDGGVKTAGIDGGVPIPSARLSASSDVMCAALKRPSCWGDDTFGQILGDFNGSPTTKLVLATPTTSTPDPDTGEAVLVSPGFQHTCAFLTGGATGTKGVVECWGQSEYSQLGMANGPSPQVVDTSDNLIDIVDLAAHIHFTCALRSDSRVLCWGRGASVLGVNSLSYFLLGNGALDNQQVPTSVVW